MDKEAIWRDYIAREKHANRPGGPGADPKVILETLAEHHGATYEEARGIILDRTAPGGG